MVHDWLPPRFPGAPRLVLTALLTLLLCLPALAGERPSVAFVSWGGRGDAFFQPMTDFMQAAADDLGFDLEVYYGERNHVVFDENLRSIFERQEHPDYIVSMDALGYGAALLPLAEAHGVKTVFINQGFVGVTRERVGSPGNPYRNWLFEFIPDDRQAGILLARTLLREARERGLTDGNGVVNLVAVGGQQRSTPAQLRDQGLAEVMEGDSRARLLQLEHADWKQSRALVLARGMLFRHPEASVVWSASDVMGLGVLEAIRESGREPGRDVLTGGVDWAAPALDKVRSGEFVTTVGGHYMDGAWALVMLYDHIHGVEVPRSSRSSFSELTRDNLDAYQALFGEGKYDAIDFRTFSKHLNPDLAEYDFGLDGVFRRMQAQ